VENVNEMLSVYKMQRKGKRFTRRELGLGNGRNEGLGENKKQKYSCEEKAIKAAADTGLSGGRNPSP